jgi:hypothetical protein
MKSNNEGNIFMVGLIIQGYGDLRNVAPRHIRHLVPLGEPPVWAG